MRRRKSEIKGGEGKGKREREEKRKGKGEKGMEEEVRKEREKERNHPIGIFFLYSRAHLILFCLFFRPYFLPSLLSIFSFSSIHI